MTFLDAIEAASAAINPAAPAVIDAAFPQKTWPAGEFLGDFPLLRIKPFSPTGNGRDYDFDPALGDFSFKRSNGEVIPLGKFNTDGGTIPKFLWSIPGLHLDPWTYIWSYLFHDYEYVKHHLGIGDRTLLEANSILAEAITTEIANHAAPGTNRDVNLIFRAVNGIVGQIAWAQSTTQLEDTPVQEIGKTVAGMAADDAKRLLGWAADRWNWLKQRV
jgi:hypothetical protein